MFTIDKLSLVLTNSKKKAEDIILEGHDNLFERKEKIIPNGYLIEGEKVDRWPNRYYYGDNIMAIKELLEGGYRGSIDLIYIDPPFLTKTKYSAKIPVKRGTEKDMIEYFTYNDIWKDGFSSYLEMLCVRLLLMKELLSDKGTIYVHLDYRTMHYMKVLMDQIFGKNNFLNEIIWSYKSGGASGRRYSRKHDTILVYTKGENYIFNPQLEKSYNRDFKPYRFKGVKEYEDEIGWYTLINLRDVWQIDMVGRTSRERIGYSTQKPEKLLERIILSSSNEESIVADFFAGSGTTGVVAEKLNRKWIMVDKGSLAYNTINRRLIKEKADPYYIYSDRRAQSIGKLILKEIDLIRGKGGKIQYRIELDEYRLDLNRMSLKDGDRCKIEEILSTNSLDLIDFIGIDTNYDYDIPKIRWCRTRNMNNLNNNSIINIGNIDKGSNDIYIKYIDIFGNENSEIISI